jgi:integrase
MFDPSPLTLGQYVEQWLPQVAPRLATSTLCYYRRFFRTDLRPLLARPLVELTRREIRDVLLVARARTRCGAAAKNAFVALASCLRSAVDEELLVVSPAHASIRRVLSPKVPHVGQSRAMPAEHVRRFLARLDRDAPPVVADCLLTLALSGLRVGEGIALRRDDLDAEHLRLRVAHTMLRVTHQLGPPKNRRTRYVNVPANLAERLLRRHGDAAAGAWLFPSPRRVGRPISYDFISKRMREVLEAAGLPRHYSPHWLRHAWACAALEQTKDPFYVQRQLGHSSIQLTCDLYGAAADPARPEVVAHFRGLLDDVSPGR